MKFTIVLVTIVFALVLFTATVDAGKKGDTIIIAGHKEEGHGCHCPMYIPFHHGHFGHGFGGYRR